MKTIHERPKIVDLFAGCGGFSLGAHLAGFDVALAVDLDPILTSSFATNFPKVPLLRCDLSTIEAEALGRRLQPERISGVIGGPPCQAFSEIGRHRKGDERRDLVWHFFRIVEALRPSFFVMENVRGLAFSGNREVLERGLGLVADRYEIVGPMLLNAARYGAPTKRARLFVIGVNKADWDVPDPQILTSAAVETTTVRSAIADLAGAQPLPVDQSGFDWWAYGPGDDLSPYARSARLPPRAGLGDGAVRGRFSGHRCTQHTGDVVRRFSTVRPGASDAVGKHVRLEWDGLCGALRAGTGSDRGSYQSVRPLHPDQDRVITIREGARLQGFPDWFLLHPTAWHSFRMIGNSVSPPAARAVLSWLAGHRARLPILAEAAE